MNYSRSETAFMAREATEIFQDAERMMGDKMIMEFKYVDVEELCKDLAALPEFRMWSREDLERIFTEAQDRRNRGVMTQYSGAGKPIFGSHS